MSTRTLRGIAIFGALLATFGEMHPFCDLFVQSSKDATTKGRPGWQGRRACAHHVATYTATQYAAAEAVTRALGAPVPIGPMLAGQALTAISHYMIDRRTLFTKVIRSRLVGKTEFLDYAHVLRPGANPGVRDVHGHPVYLNDAGGPGTAYMELDQAAHRFLGVASALITAWLAVRSDRTRP